MIEHYQKYARAIVRQLMRSLRLPDNKYEDYLAAGYLGLVEAAERFDFKNGNSFKSYAYLRIRGAIIDGIRKSSEISGRAYKYAKALHAAQELRESCNFGPGEVRRRNGMSATEPDRLKEIFNYAAKSTLAFRLNFMDVEEELTETSESNSGTDELLAKRERARLLRQIVSELPEKERCVIERYYFQDQAFVEIANEFEGFSKSWVSRLHGRALEIIRKRYLEKTR